MYERWLLHIEFREGSVSLETQGYCFYVDDSTSTIASAAIVRCEMYLSGRHIRLYANKAQDTYSFWK